MGSREMLEDSKRKGFTLVEAVVVCVIIGILSAVALICYRPVLCRAYEAGAKSKIKAIARVISFKQQERESLPPAFNEQDMKSLFKMRFSETSKYSYSGVCGDNSCTSFTLRAMPKIECPNMIEYNSETRDFVIERCQFTSTEDEY